MFYGFMNVDHLLEMAELIEVDDPIYVDPLVFAISVMAKGNGPYAIWFHAQYHLI